MSDLIDRLKAIDAIDGTLLDEVSESIAIDILLDLPSAQPEIIRCKDCKYSEHWYRDKRRCFLWVEDGIDVFDDGFCNYAKRRTMSDLIDRQAAIEEIARWIGYIDEDMILRIQTGLKKTPSAQPQPETIRCKDCRYRYIDEKFGPSCELDTGDPYATGRNADEDNWFCADAERRTDERLNR